MVVWLGLFLPQMAQMRGLDLRNLSHLRWSGLVAEPRSDAKPREETSVATSVVDEASCLVVFDPRSDTKRKTGETSETGESGRRARRVRAEDVS